MTSARIPCTAIKRYPVVARWRDDVDFVQAGIYCFQPYCVTGELEPPANPLICPQFCLRFNDLDNIGITGRHYSGFIMLGIQVFNKPNDYKFWADECVEFNFRWLTEELGIHPDEITFIEDVWAGGGNLGPSIEYFVSGLEVGNMVFMQFKTFPDGSREPLQVQVIDVGIGLERIPWLINGSATSYQDVFPTALNYFLEKTKLDIRSDIWEKFGPLSCLLNVDEVEDLSKTWQWIADKIGMDVATVRAAVEPIRDAYVVLDHTRTLMMAIQDGALPANTGGGSNIRNVLRRTFAIMHKNKWWDHFGLEGFLELFKCHQKDLANIYGEFPPYSSFPAIIEREYSLYKHHDVEQRKVLERFIQKKKGAPLTLDDWILCITSYGIPADLIQNSTGQEPPLDLWYQIDYRSQQVMRAAAPILYSTAHLPPTVSLYDDEHDHRQMTFENATVVDIMHLDSDENKPLSVLVLNESPFYPTSGGQDHDTGFVVIDGVRREVVDVIRVGPCVLHIVEPPFADKSCVGKSCSGEVDKARRDQLRAHHTATHLVYATCREVLGPHVWQHGARKKVEEARLDITHYAALSHEQLQEIEWRVNQKIREGRKITKNTQPKEVAELKYGFTLYQGGVVPGNTLRIVDIEGTDTEACCGTHCDNTGEVGLVKFLSAQRYGDGILRLTYVAGDRALREINHQTNMLNQICTNLDTQMGHVVHAATDFFKRALKAEKRCEKQAERILELQMKLVAADSHNKVFIIPTDESTATLYIGVAPAYTEMLQKDGKAVIFVGQNYVYGLAGAKDLVNVDGIKAALKAAEEAEYKRQVEKAQAAADPETKVDVPALRPAQLIVKDKVQAEFTVAGKKQKKQFTDVVQFQSFQVYDSDGLIKYFAENCPSAVRF